MRLFVGDDWAEDYHDVEVMDEAGKVLADMSAPIPTSWARRPGTARKLTASRSSPAPTRR
jgi:hypothetical protein